MKFLKSKKSIINLSVICVALIAVILLALFVSNESECVICKGSGHGVACSVCEGTGVVSGEDCGICEGNGFILDEEDENGDFVCSACGGAGSQDNPYYGTIVSLLPPIIAIVLALITKEVYSSLFIGIVAGGLFAAKFNLIDTVTNVTVDGIISNIADSWNAGILVFLVLLGIIVSLVNKAGGAYAFGNWAKQKVKTKVGASLATFALGVIIFIDDYFNCLTVGSVMRPVTDSKKMSREKLAYLIDATAAPICMIAPISSWAAAVSSTASSIGVNGISLFVSAIPYNFYSLLTIITVISMSILRIEFGPMKKYEQAAELMDQIQDETQVKTEGTAVTERALSRCKTIDLVIPIIVLIVFCVIGMLFTGGFFDKTADNYLSLVGAFGDSDASVGLSLGSIVSLLIIIVYMIARRLLTFNETMESIPQGFKAMVPAILILTFAWTLNSMTSSLGAKYFVFDKLNGAAEGLYMMLPAIIFLIAVGLAFSTGTSWGTFGILIPIVVAVFSAGQGQELMTIGISACLAGAVCGDHCSPISDTTIMASAGANCTHLNHVSTQLPYALTVAAVSFVSYILAGLIQKWFIVLPISIVLMIGTLLCIRFIQNKKVKVEE